MGLNLKSSVLALATFLTPLVTSAQQNEPVLRQIPKHAHIMEKNPALSSEQQKAHYVGTEVTEYANHAEDNEAVAIYQQRNDQVVTTYKYHMSDDNGDGVYNPANELDNIVIDIQEIGSNFSFTLNTLSMRKCGYEKPNVFLNYDPAVVASGSKKLREFDDAHKIKLDENYNKAVNKLRPAEMKQHDALFEQIKTEDTQFERAQLAKRVAEGEFKKPEKNTEKHFFETARLIGKGYAGFIKGEVTYPFKYGQTQ